MNDDLSSLLHSPSRRAAIVACSAVVTSLILPDRHALASDFWSRPRRLTLERKVSGKTESYHGVYFANGNLVWDEYLKICHIMRDVRANTAVQMSPVLLDILCGVQGVLQAHDGSVRPLVTTSGYRSPATNSRLEGAARSSLHMQGRAWDGHTPGATPAAIASIGQYLRGGGVGVYMERGFCHLDDGRLRSWHG